jgi:peptidoglycan/LPS O-acetylase OafA/YrhL
VFFVISGFVITSVILRERDASAFSLWHFYARRIRRLFPALSLVLIATGLLGWFYLLPHEFQNLGKHIFTGTAYYTNFMLNRELGYFDTAAGEKPLLHLWSLSVEEQFYIVWPILLLLVRNRRALALIVAGLMIASFSWGIYTLSRNHGSAFYHPQYRVWELGLGSLLAITAARWPDDKPRTATLLSSLGVLLIGGTIFFLADQERFPGVYAVIPTLGAALIIAAGPGSAINRFVLGHPAIVYIGLISYPLYLWHWPLLSFAHILGLGTEPVAILTIVTLSFVLAAATYSFVERPVRHSGASFVPAALVMVTVLVGIVGSAIYRDRLAPRLDAAVYRDIDLAFSDWGFGDGLVLDRVVGNAWYHSAGKGADTLLVVGDSNAEQYWPRLQYLLRENGAQRPVLFVTAGGCLPIPGMNADINGRCAGFGEQIAQLARSPDISAILVAANWSAYFHDPARKFKGLAIARGSPGWDAAFGGLSDMMRAFTSREKPAWLVLGIPTGTQLGPVGNLQRSWMGAATLRPVSISRSDLDPLTDSIRSKLVVAAHDAGARVIDPMATLCDASVCTLSNGSPIYKDGSHLRGSFVREHATFLDEVMGPATASLKR